MCATPPASRLPANPTRLSPTLNAIRPAGLVIRAKSMFDEPIRTGLIRFADAYDQAQQTEPDSRRARAVRPPARRAARNSFSLSHQPLLVIYTNRIG